MSVTAKIVPPPVTQSEVVLTMDMETAEILLGVVSSIAGTGEPRGCVDRIRRALNSCGILLSAAELYSADDSVWIRDR